MNTNRTISNSSEHVIVHFEMFDGYATFGGIDILPSSGLGSYLKDEVSGWMEDLWKPAYVEKTPVCGVFLRESREHGFVWFPRPSFVQSFHGHAGVVYSLVKNGPEDFRTWLHPMFDRLIAGAQDSGFTEVPMERADLVRAAAVPVAVCTTQVDAHRTTCDHISLLTDRIM